MQQGMVVWGEGGWPCILAFEWKKKALSPQTGGVESERTHSQLLEYSPRTAVPCFPTQPVQIAVVLPRHCADLCMRMISALRQYVEAALLFTNPPTTGFGWTSWNFAKQIEGRRKCFNYENDFFFFCNVKMTEPCRLLQYKSSCWCKCEYECLSPPWD